MEDKSRRHLSLLDDFTLYQPDRSEQSLDVIQREDTLLFSETKQDAAALLKAWLASSVALEVSPYEFSTLVQKVATNSSPQATKSSSQGKIDSSPQDRIIRTLIAYTDNEANATLRRTNKDYRDRLRKKLKSISRYICTLACNWREVVLQDMWQAEDDLKVSRLILLLLDDNFVNTDYCICPGLKGAVTRHKRGTTYVIPIYLHPCLITATLPFYDLPFYLSKTQAVSQFNNRDTAFEIISREIRKAVEDLRDNILPITGQ